MADRGRSKISRSRLASSIFIILLAAILIMGGGIGGDEGGVTVFLSNVVLIAGAGNLCSAVFLLTRLRDRHHVAPMSVLIFAGLSLLVGLIVWVDPFFGGAIFIISLLFSAPAFILLGLDVHRARRIS
jgi:drug/metabolite transporter (DMT)-like permease